MIDCLRGFISAVVACGGVGLLLCWSTTPVVVLFRLSFLYDLLVSRGRQVVILMGLVVVWLCGCMHVCLHVHVYIYIYTYLYIRHRALRHDSGV